MSLYVSAVVCLRVSCISFFLLSSGSRFGLHCGLPPVLLSLFVQGSGIPAEEEQAWVSREVAHFFESCAIPLFASTFLSLSPFLAEEYAILPSTAGRRSVHRWHGLPPSHVYVETFM